MVRQRGIRRVLVAFAFLAVFIAGYFATSVATSCQAEAQVCCLMPCIAIVPGTAPSIAALDAGIVAPAIIWSAASIGSYYLVSLAQFTIKIFKSIGVVINNWVGWWDSFWFYDMNPLLQDMTKQLSYLDAAQARAIGGFKDMMALNRAINSRIEKQAESHEEERPGENVCTAGSLGGGMTQASVLSSAYATASTVEDLNRTGNAVGTPAAAGTKADIDARFQNYVSKYCDPGDNAGHPGCTPATAPAPENFNRDLDVTGLVFRDPTTDVKDPKTMVAIKDLVTNIAQPFVKDNMPVASFETPQGRMQVIKNEEEKTQRQIISSALYYIISRRAPTSGLDDQIGEIDEARGVLPGSASPSIHEVMQNLAKYKSRTGDVSVRQIDEPENNDREAVIQAGIRTRQLSDIIDVTDRLLVLVAAQVGTDLSDRLAFTTKTELVPQK